MLLSGYLSGPYLVLAVLFLVVMWYRETRNTVLLLQLLWNQMAMLVFYRYPVAFPNVFGTLCQSVNLVTMFIATVELLFL